MSATELIRLANSRGLELIALGPDRLRVRGPNLAIEEMRLALLGHKPQILAILRECDAMTAADVVRVAEKIIRDLAPGKPRRQRRQGRS